MSRPRTTKRQAEHVLIGWSSPASRSRVHAAQPHIATLNSGTVTPSHSASSAQSPMSSISTRRCSSECRSGLANRLKSDPLRGAKRARMALATAGSRAISVKLRTLNFIL